MTIDKNTLLIHVESGAYPLNLVSLKSRHKNISFTNEVDVAEINALGYAVVARTERPVGDVVTETAPELGADGYVQKYAVREFTEDEKSARLENRKTMIAGDINASRERTLAQGAPIDFGGDTGVLHVQMRDGDRANILGLQQGAQRAADNGVTDAVLPLRTAEDVTVMLTPEQMIAAAWLVFDAYQEVMSTSWTVKDKVLAVKDVSEIVDVPDAFTPSVRALV